MNSEDIEKIFRAFTTKDERLFHQVAQEIIEHEEQLNHHLVVTILRKIINDQQTPQSLL